VTEAMKLAAAQAIFGLVEKPRPDEIVPSVFHEGVSAAVATEVARLAGR
jgi:malate dehydrogenase (oxaloacetate-decarboxylating)